MKKRLAAALCAASILWAGAFVPARAEQAAPDGGPAALAQFLDEARTPALPMCWKGRTRCSTAPDACKAPRRTWRACRPAARVRCWFATIRRRTRTRSFLPREGPQRRKGAGRFWRTPGAVGGPAARPVPGRDAGKSCRHQGVGQLAHICVQCGCIAAGRYGRQNGHQLRRERRYAVSGLCLLVQRQ